MQVNSFKAILAGLAIVLFATACTSRHEESKVVTNAKSGVAGTPVSPAQLALTAEMKNYQEGFDFSNQSLARKVTGISLLSIDSAPTVDGVYYLKGRLMLSGADTSIELSSAAISESDLRKGALITVNFSGQAASAVLGSPLIIKARCMDENCRQVSMWLSTAGEPSMDGSASSSIAGYIFSGKTGAYVIAAQQTGDTVSAVSVENQPFGGDKK